MVFPLIAILGAAAIGGMASLGAGAMQANAAEKAAKTQAEAADRGLALQTRMYEEGTERSRPWVEAGRTALNAYQNELGIGPEARAGTYTSAFQESPGYQFQVEEGERGVTNSLSALGMKNSGAALKALTRFRTGLANQEHGNWLSRLGGAAGMGQSATDQQNALAANYAGNATTTGNDAAAARASGYTGSAQAWSGALGNISNIAGNALGMMPGNAFGGTGGSNGWSLGGGLR